MAKAMNPPGASCGGGADVNTQLNCICDTDAAGNAVQGTCEPVGWESSQGGGYGGSYCTKSEAGAAGMSGTAWVQNAIQETLKDNFIQFMVRKECHTLSAVNLLKKV